MTVCVYGATGYTGRLVALELARQGIPMVLSGRSAQKVAARAREVAAAGGEVVREAPAALDDAAGLRAAMDGCDAVLNCAGPFIHTGAPVLRAAIDAGCHYLDTTGEQPWVAEVFERFGADLDRAGVAAIPAMGFDYVPGDLLCNLVGTQLEPLHELVVAYDVAGFGMTRGTMRSALEMMKGGDVVYEDGAWRPGGNGPLRSTIAFPELGPRRMAKYPAGEIVTVPRHVRTRRVQALLSAVSIAPAPVAGALPVLQPALGATLRIGPLRRVLHDAIGRLPEGPHEDARRAAAWTILAIARGEDGREAQGVVRGPDVYGITAVCIVHGAQLLASGDVRRGSGALSPAMAFAPEAFLAALAPHGVQWSA